MDCSFWPIIDYFQRSWHGHNTTLSIFWRSSEYALPKKEVFIWNLLSLLNQFYSRTFFLFLNIFKVFFFYYFIMEPEHLCLNLNSFRVSCHLMPVLSCSPCQRKYAPLFIVRGIDFEVRLTEPHKISPPGEFPVRRRWYSSQWLICHTVIIHMWWSPRHILVFLFVYASAAVAER